MNDIRWWIHNLVAHPLLVLWPSMGEKFHAATEPREDYPTPNKCEQTQVHGPHVWWTDHVQGTLDLDWQVCQGNLPQRG